MLCVSLYSRTNIDLVRFLKAHNGDNFVKTHGADINKFVHHDKLSVLHYLLETRTSSEGAILPVLTYVPYACNKPVCILIIGSVNTACV